MEDGAPYGRRRRTQKTSIKSREVRLPAERLIPPRSPTGNVHAQASMAHCGPGRTRDASEIAGSIAVAMLML
jgi:hypothetical protein